ncbi:NUDIX domain-containing protein [Candidatus Woesearchaeota archaeon]|nr:NUDIX domain-containing protein [Candidatus Woesearchaeota archaeon]
MSDTKLPKVATGIIIYNDNNNKILLVQSHKWPGKWLIPGGGVEWGETAEACAIREVKEETNLDITDITLVDVQESIFPKEFYQERHFIFFDYTAKVINNGNKIILNEELQEYQWIKPEEALALDLNNDTRKFLEKLLKRID